MLEAVSLTRLIDDRHGPVREFFEQRLPDLRTFRDRWRAAGPPTLLPVGANPPWGILGAAIDYRIRYLFDAPDPSNLVAAMAHLDLGGSETEDTILARLGPLFQGSGDVGGADGDLIVGHMLLEFKTTKNPPQRAYLYQLIGYLLLDYDDRYEIDELGFFITRIPALITWPADELLTVLAGKPVDRGSLRADFRDAVAASQLKSADPHVSTRREP